MQEDNNIVDHEKMAEIRKTMFIFDIVARMTHLGSIFPADDYPILCNYFLNRVAEGHRPDYAHDYIWNQAHYAYMQSTYQHSDEPVRTRK